jgi:hypothetical protein
MGDKTGQGGQAGDRGARKHVGRGAVVEECEVALVGHGEMVVR